MNEDHDTDGEPIGVTIQRRASFIAYLLGELNGPSPEQAAFILRRAIQGMERCIAQAKVLRHAAMTRCRIADLEEATDAKN